MKSHSKKNNHFYIPLFESPSIVKKRDHRNKYLGLLILNLYVTLKILIHKQQRIVYTQHQTFFSQFFAIKTEKEQAINLRQKYFHSYDTYTLIILH